MDKKRLGVGGKVRRTNCEWSSVNLRARRNAPKSSIRQIRATIRSVGSLTLAAMAGLVTGEEYIAYMNEVEIDE